MLLRNGLQLLVDLRTVCLVLIRQNACVVAMTGTSDHFQLRGFITIGWIVDRDLLLITNDVGERDTRRSKAVGKVVFNSLDGVVGPVPLIDLRQFWVLVAVFEFTERSNSIQIGLGDVHRAELARDSNAVASKVAGKLEVFFCQNTDGVSKVGSSTGATCSNSSRAAHCLIKVDNSVVLEMDQLVYIVDTFMVNDVGRGFMGKAHARERGTDLSVSSSHGEIGIG